MINFPNINNEEEPLTKNIANNQKPLTITFDQSKKEDFTIFSGFRLLHKHLRSSWNVEINNNELTDLTFEMPKIFILPLPRAKFYTEEFDALRKFVQSGGSLLVMMSEGGETQADTNINFLLEEFGIVSNPDSVIRISFYKYFDPKEALISNGITNRSIANTATNMISYLPFSKMPNNIESKSFNKLTFNNNNFNSHDNYKQSALSFVYPFGSTLLVNRDAVVVLSTGTLCFPINRPICAFHNTNGGGRVAVIGSTHIFSDEYFEKEQNAKIFDVIIMYLNDGFNLNQIDAVNPDLADLNTIPDHIQLSNQLKMCLQESEIEQVGVGVGVGVGLNGDFTKLFDSTICSIGLDNWPETIRCYKRLGFDCKPLNLVAPVFEVPQLLLKPAVFPPNFREISAPKLELFDLDDAFSSYDVRLAQLTNRCNDDELDVFVRESGELLGINRKLLPKKLNSKQILEHVLYQIAEYKKFGQDMDLPSSYIVDNVVDNISDKNNIKHYSKNNHAFELIEDEHYFSDIDEYDNFNKG